MSGDLLVRRARVVPIGAPHTPGGDEPAVLDVRVRAGVVTEIGPELADDGSHELDADGRWLIPGLWDQHVHMTQWARTFARIDLVGTRSPHEVIERLLPALEHASGIVVGFGYRTASWSEQPTVELLDQVARETPVVLISGDAHNGWLSSAAQQLLGAPRTSGVLTEYDWFPVMARLDDLPRDEIAEQGSLGAAITRASEMGVVGITDLEFSRCWERWPEVYDAWGLRSLRVRAATYSDALDDVIARGLRTGDALEHGKGLLTMGPLKVIADGSLNTRTAYCCTPYADDPEVRGALNLSPAELTELLTRAHRSGLRTAVHSIGDAAVETSLDAYETSGAVGTIEHAQLVLPEHGRRMARLGVAASVQPAHLIDDRDVTQLCWPDRADRCFRLRSLLDAGVRLQMGSDAPVAPLDPWLAMATAVHRTGDQREPWNPAESLTAAEALRASVASPTGVAVGSAGDLVLLERDPLARHESPALAAESLRQMPVATTVVDGRLVHDVR